LRKLSSATRGSVSSKKTERNFWIMWSSRILVLWPFVTFRVRRYFTPALRQLYISIQT